MRTLAIGDVHGCLTALVTLEKLVGLADDDTVVLLGDLVDRGPDSAGVLDWALASARRRRTVVIRGNHELMMLAARYGGMSSSDFRSWHRFGGAEALESYANRRKNTGWGWRSAPQLSEVPAEHWELIEEVARPFFEGTDHFFVHAGAYPMLPLVEQPEDALYWGRFEDMGRHVSGKVMVCGHTEQHSGLPLATENAVCLDTHCYGGGWLTCLDVGSGRVWQAGDDGRTRQGALDDLDALAAA